MRDSTKTKKAIAAHDQEQLPWEMIEEILSHFPPISLVRFRTVCKRWNALFNDKTFLDQQPQVYISFHLNNQIQDLLESQITHLVDCNEFLLCGMDKGATVWNPWLKQSRWIKTDVSQPSFLIYGIGYDNNNSVRVAERRYKTIGSYRIDQSEWETQDFASDVWKDLELEPIQGDKSMEDKTDNLLTRGGVLLSGNLYWIGFYDESDPLYHLVNFDFSSERFFNVFCYLPCGTNHPLDALVLRVYKEDRLSLLKQCHMTKKIEIWVTKNKINIENGDDVVWMNFMNFSIPSFPNLVLDEFANSQPSYFIDNKRLVLCSCDETGQPWIYVVEENKLIRKVQLNDVVDPWPLHCTYFPSLVPVPRGPREEALLQV